MHILQVSFYLTTAIYVLFCQFWLLYWFIGFIALYCLIAAFYPGSQSLSIRRKFTLATWSPPSDGIITNNIKLRVDKLLQYLQTFPKQQRPTLTHFAILACGEVLKQSPDMNGKLIFGKFVPYQTCDVSCFVNIDGPNDVGMILVRDVPNKTLSQIGQFIRNRSKKMRPKGGDQQHKKRFELFDILPSFIVSIVYRACIFLTSYFGLNIPSLALQKDAVGAIIVSSVGSFGYIDAYTSFFGTVGQFILLTLNAVHQEPVIQNGKIQIGKVVNVNCTIDHRYLHSGGRGQKLVQIFKDVFQNPQKYKQSRIKKHSNLTKQA